RKGRSRQCRRSQPGRRLLDPPHGRGNPRADPAADRGAADGDADGDAATAARHHAARPRSAGANGLAGSRPARIFGSGASDLVGPAGLQHVRSRSPGAPCKPVSPTMKSITLSRLSLALIATLLAATPLCSAPPRDEALRLVPDDVAFCLVI